MHRCRKPRFLGIQRLAQRVGPIRHQREGLAIAEFLAGASTSDEDELHPPMLSAQGVAHGMSGTVKEPVESCPKLGEVAVNVFRAPGLGGPITMPPKRDGVPIPRQRRAAGIE